VLPSDDGTFGEDHRALQHVPQLADVARPRLGDEASRRRLVEARRGPTVGEPGEEGLGDRHDVLGAIAKGGQADREDGQAMVEVLSERALSDHRPQVSVGRGDPAHVHVDGGAAAEPLELPLLEHAQELGLELLVELSDLVQEERPPVGELDAAAALDVGAGERALLVAEELALEEALREDGAVDGDEGALRARAHRVERPRRHLLAGAALSL